MGHFMKEVGAFEAKNRLGTLLDWVEQGEEVVITRRGKAVARLVQVRSGVDREKARDAAQRIRDMSRGVTLGEISIKSLIDAGRQ
jgi:prevent-host-death family protein